MKAILDTVVTVIWGIVLLSAAVAILKELGGPKKDKP